MRDVREPRGALYDFVRYEFMRGIIYMWGIMRCVFGKAKAAKVLVACNFIEIMR